VVFDGKYLTAAGVAAGIGMALALTGRIAGDEAAQASQLALEYDLSRTMTPDRRPPHHHRYVNGYGAASGPSSPADPNKSVTFGQTRPP
jgi:transcriptional regulator GlxA family with amidase domain